MKDINRKELIHYIENSWDELTVSTPQDNETHLGLPNPFVAPSVHRTEGFVFREQFYWDTYFTVLALIKSGRKELAQGMVENLLFLLDKLGYVPNSSNKSHLGRTQPPLLSSMVVEVAKINKNKTWLMHSYELLKNEYNNVWMSNQHPHNRLTKTGLSRYYHENQTHKGAEEECGWDFNTRFEDRALDFLPIDLNCFLYKYERDFVQIASVLKLEQESVDWAMKSEERKKKINELMWNETKGLYFDYDFVNSRQGNTESLATFLPLYYGLASKVQATSVYANLDKFETDYGLTITNKSDKKIDGKQWVSPNGWAPLHLFTTEGLKNYGFNKKATEIEDKWVSTVLYKLNKTGEIYEKYNMINPDENPAHAIYPDQVGFAWTNAVTLLYLK